MRQITLAGYGNQGRAWAANLRDSGWKVTISGRVGGQGSLRAAQDGFAVIPAEELRSCSGLIALLMPDEAIAGFFAAYLAGGEKRQFVFAHGFAVTFGKLPISPSDDLILVAPKGIGQKLRENYVAGGGVMGVLGVDRDASGQAWASARALASGLGLDRVGILESSFAEETKADLLSEQVILCGAAPRLVKDTVAFLVEKGIDPRLAEYECLNELKLIVDMMVEHGVDGMMRKVSTVARYGGEHAASVVLPAAELRSRTEKLWGEIESGAFAQALREHLARKKAL